MLSEKDGLLTYTMSFSHSHFYLYDIGINANMKMYIVKPAVPCNLKGKKGVNYKVAIFGY